MSFWPFLVFLAAFYAVVATPVFAAADTPPSDKPRRVGALDGLRGVLALGVVIAHVTLFRTLLETGRVSDLALTLFSRVGEAAVALFFMITGTLFWSMLLRENGRPDWLGLYVGRIFRIGPLYLAAVFVLFAVVFMEDRFHPPEAWALVVRHAADWLALGAHDPVDLDGTGRSSLLLGVAWTLRYEWHFYVALLPLASIARLGRAHLPVVALALAASLAAAAASGGRAFTPTLPIAFALFLSGMLTGSMLRIVRLDAIPNVHRSALALALVVTALACPLIYAAMPVACLAAAFLLIASGADMGGLLTSRAARRAGDVSYGIYLLHLFVLCAAVHFATARRLLLDGTAGFWIVTFAVAVVATVLATGSHVVIERPGIALGKRVGRSVRETALKRLSGERVARSRTTPS